MSTCEKCWADAYFESVLRGTLQADEYLRLLKQRDGSICPPVVPEEA